MITISECLSNHQELKFVSDTARLDTEILLAKAINKPRAYLYTWAEKTLTEEQLRDFTRWFHRRKQGEPVAYILGEKEFWSLKLAVNSATLIPRPETELLVESLLTILPRTKHQILDLGTGCGAIAVAIANARPNWQILAVDNSPEAVQLAIDNCRNLGLSNVAISRSFWYKNIRSGPFSAIVCNPPYVAASDPNLLEGDVRFEPRDALVADEDGMADIRTVVNGARNHLLDHGWLLIEHGWNQGDKVRELFQKNRFVDIVTKKDLAGHERITLGRFPG